MKKLMFLAGVAAAMVASANVCVTTKDECGEELLGGGTAHKVAISLKTTGLAKTTKKVQCEDAECTYYRVQKTVKINGYIYGQLDDDCAGCTLLGSRIALWTKTDGIVLNDLAIAMGIYGKGVKSNKIEAYGSIEGDDFGALTWAGFGSLTVKKGKENKCGDDTECSAWVKSISGGIAGVLVVPEYACVDCDPIAYENCCDDMGMLEGVTAAYGTIKITYDAATAKKVASAVAKMDAADDADEVVDAVIDAKAPKSVDVAEIAANVTINDVTIEE